MRVCEVMLARGFGGAERYFVDTCKYLAGAGHPVLAICDPRSRVRPMLQGVSGIEMALLAAAGTWDPLAVWCLKRELARWRPDVVQAHLARAAHIAGKAAHALHRHVLVMTHNYVDLKYYRHVDFFLPATHDQARYLVAGGIGAERMEVVPNFSALSPVAELPVVRPDAPIKALGRLVHKKGFHVLLEAMAQVRESVPGASLVLGGDGPERAALELRARELHLDDCVSFAGWQQDAAEFLEGAVIFALPSLDEPFGIVVLEAMACGVPVVATRTAGPSEILVDDSGWIVPPGDAKALATALTEALSGPEQRRRKAAAALGRFRCCYAREVVMPRIEGLLQRLAGAHSD